jgi:phage terminase large subunit-like protein
LQSVAERLAKLTLSERKAVISRLSDAEAEALLHDWRGFLARPDQIAPDGDWDIWLALAGRGWGKTETGAQWIREQVEAGVKSIALVAETQKDLEEVMVRRLVSIYPDNPPKVRYKPVRVEWPNGATALGYNGTEPNQLRGPEFEIAWVDELAKYRYARETWDMLQFCMRAGTHPRVLVTTTPRPIDLIKAIASNMEGKVHVTRGRTSDNRANLAPGFVEKITQRYEGTRLGRQELNAEILGDIPGALWTQATLDTFRAVRAPDLARVVVAIDPAVTSEEDSDEHGIIVAGIADDAEAYVVEDASLRGTPLDWAKQALVKYRMHQADALVVEVNNGGDMIAHTIRSLDPNAKVKEVRATRGKHVRAEPIAALYEQGRVHHVGSFPELESQMTQMTNDGYQGTGSPDRLDAAVWALTDLFPDMTQPIADVSRFAIPRGRAGGWLGS